MIVGHADKGSTEKCDAETGTEEPADTGFEVGGRSICAG